MKLLVALHTHYTQGGGSMEEWNRDIGRRATTGILGRKMREPYVFYR